MMHAVTKSSSAVLDERVKLGVHDVVTIHPESTRDVPFGVAQRLPTERLEATFTRTVARVRASVAAASTNLAVRNLLLMHTAASSDVA
jgi:hypothetical protein